MYSKILVPLDGSELAECVLPHVEAMAGGCKVKDVVLVRVVEPFRLPTASDYAMPPEEVARIDARSMAEADSYLKKVQGKVRLDGTRVQSELLRGNPAEALADYASKKDVDLIIIATRPLRGKPLGLGERGRPHPTLRLRPGYDGPGSGMRARNLREGFEEITHRFRKVIKFYPFHFLPRKFSP